MELMGHGFRWPWVFCFGGHGGLSLDLWFWYGIEVISGTQRMGFGVGMIWFLFSFAAKFVLPMGYGFEGFLRFYFELYGGRSNEFGFFFFYLIVDINWRFVLDYLNLWWVWRFSYFEHGVCDRFGLLVMKVFWHVWRECVGMREKIL